MQSTQAETAVEHGRPPSRHVRMRGKKQFTPPLRRANDACAKQP
ncbi:hypothetical protein BSIN_0651 [Burkholderia singularis]|uniref:Uncharacterized protein n=1 Tax=Burkholderia singularis TaxID=1503053 RepID=A0A238H980_9BURK|nr:hypothetical protein BSIN_0651 [Burkholderia singularis]